ncbi:hypothetical protein [Micromonospora sp. WMMD710]|uniref:hypothetical protein n=1 Tax=Micromonospora sp. WMMD710 TaxID=3016085 RepID=UPI0024171F83|nr:hypothetical protein [Micromonospora sp. WMMD710]MDG4759276.1 hypothetical protein [Micromonospora sp. WMMD710]
MPSSGNDESVLGSLTPSPLTPEQFHDHQVTRDLIAQALAAQSARRYELEQTGGDPGSLEQVIASQSRLAQALRDLDPADIDEVARHREESVAVLRQARG